MCTAFKYKQYFCRNYDYEESYDETVKLIPKDSYDNQYSIIGVCSGLVEDYPLMYDGMNEHGLCMGGLAFKGNAYYVNADDVPYGSWIYAPYDFILHILGNFKTVDEVRIRLQNTYIFDKQYSDDFPNTDLHWMIIDKEKSIVVEATKDGLDVYDNPYEVLTNNPPFNMMMDEITFELTHTIGVHSDFDAVEWESRGTETVGLMGDTTSVGRFERVAYLKEKAKTTEGISPLTQVIHLLGSVEQLYGATRVGAKYEYTIYSAIYDMIENKVMIKTYDRTLYFTYQNVGEEEIVTIEV